MTVLVVDLQNTTFEHEVFNSGLLEALVDSSGSVELIGTRSLLDYYQNEFPLLMMSVKWRSARQEKFQDFSLFGAWRLYRFLKQKVLVTDDVIVFTSTTPSTLIASLLLAQSRTQKPNRKFFFMFHGMLSNLEKRVSDRPDPWFRFSKGWIPTFYPARLLFSLRLALVFAGGAARDSGFKFGFLTTRAREKFVTLFPDLKDLAVFLPIRISHELQYYAPSSGPLIEESKRLTIGILGWHNNPKISVIVDKNPDVQFVFLGPKGAPGSNSVVLGRHVSRSEMREVAGRVDVFLLARKSAPSDWSLSGIPSEMLVYGKKLIVPDGMAIDHYGLDGELSLFMSDVFDRNLCLIPGAISPDNSILDAEFIQRSRKQLDAFVKSALHEALS